jgi:hypothetical protein
MNKWIDQHSACLYSRKCNNLNALRIFFNKFKQYFLFPFSQYLPACNLFLILSSLIYIAHLIYKGTHVMSKLNRFSLLAAAVSLPMLLGGSMVSNVHAEGDRDGGEKYGEQGGSGKDGKHNAHHRDGVHWGQHKWQIFKELNLTSAQKYRLKTS